MIDFKIYAIIGISAFLLVGGWVFSLKQEISFLKEENISLTKDYAQSLSNAQTLKGEIEIQNSKIKQNELNLAQRENELYHWKKQPPQIKYKTIEKIITKESSNECENIKNILDDVRTTSF